MSKPEQIKTESSLTSTKAGWNKSSSVHIQGGENKKIVLWWWGIVVLVVVVTTALFCFLIRSDSQNVRQEVLRTGLIKEVKPASAPKPLEADKEEPIKIDPDARPTKPGVKINNWVMLPNGKLHKVIKETTNTVSRNKGKYAIFNYASENIIAGILSVEPGGMIFGGTRKYNGKLTDDFLKSLKEPIIVSRDDPDDVQELKRAVNEAKIELKVAYDRGEDIEEIISNAREEAQSLSLYKQQLRKEVLTYANRTASTPEDVDTYLEAANKMLEAKGIAPLNDTPLTRIKLKMKEKWEMQR